MEQVNALAKFEPEAVFPSRKHLYMERDEYHMLHGYKLVVPNSNKEQVISTHSFGNHLCNSTAHPAPAKRTADIALSRFRRAGRTWKPSHWARVLGKLEKRGRQDGFSENSVQGVPVK